MTTADLAIVVTGVVGLGAPALSALFESKRERGRAARDRVAKDLDELRGLLDELAAAMYEHTTGTVELERRTQASTFSQPSSGTAPDLRTSRQNLYALNARLVVRLGRADAVVTSLGSFLRLVDDALVEVDAWYAEREPFDYSDTQLGERAARYWDAYEAFIDTAKAAVGSAR